MTGSKEVTHVFEEAKKLLDEKEAVYGDAWKTSGREACISQIFRKANYMRVQRKNGRVSTDKFLEDLLDLMNWCAFSYYLLEGGRE